MLKYYLIVLGTFAVATTIVIAMPELPSIAIQVTGYALPLLALPTLTIYLAALFPAVACRSAGWRRGPSLFIATCSVIFVALAPTHIARWVTVSEARPFLANDFRGPLPGKPRAIEFERPLANLATRNEPLISAGCDEICQKLLLAGAMDAVRVTPVNDTFRAPPPVVYTVQNRATCPKTFVSAQSALPETRLQASLGRCIVASHNADWKDSLKLVTIEQPNGWTSKWPLLSSNRDLTRHDLLFFADGQWRPVSRTTELRARILRAPLAFAYPELDGLLMVPGWIRRTLTLNKADIQEVLTAAGIQLRLSEEGEPIRETVERLVSNAEGDPLGPELMWFILRYLNTLRSAKALEDADLALLSKVVANPRVRIPRELHQLVERHPSALAAIIPGVLTRLDQAVAQDTKENYAAETRLLSQAPSESLRPFSSRIIDIASRPGKWSGLAALRVVGRLDKNTSTLLTARLRADSTNTREAAAFAICTADEPIRMSFGTALGSILVLYTQRHATPEETVLALKVLRSIGREQDVEAFLSTISESGGKAMRMDVWRYTPDDPQYCAPRFKESIH